MVGCAIAVAIALLLLRKPKKKGRFPIEASAALVAICGVSWYLVVRSGFPNGGYLFYVVLPALYVASFVLRELDTRLKLSEHYAELRKFAICQVAAISIFPQLATHLIMRVNMMETQEYQFENNFETNFSPNSQFGAVAQFLDKYRKPGDRLTLWGSRPAIYVYSGMTPGTRDIDCDIMLGANRDELTQIRWDKADYFKGVFIKDLNAVKPRFFIDVSRMYRRPEWGPPELTDATAVPAVADILKNEYNLMGTMNDPAKGPVAVVYIRKDE